MNSISYYDDMGMPRASDGSLVITITMAPDLSPLPNNILSNVPVYPAYKYMPIYTLPASYINAPRVGGAVALDQSKMPEVIPISFVFQSKIEIDEKITKSQNIMAKDLTTLIGNTKEILTNIPESITNNDILEIVQKEKDAIAGLEKAITENSQLESEILNKQKIAEQQFNNFLARRDVRLTNFKKFIDQGNYGAFHGGLMSVMSVMRNIPKVWENEVIKPNDEIIFLKNKQLEVVNRINIITDDINQSIEALNEYKEQEVLKEAIQFTSNFYQEIFSAYGEKAEQLAKELANQAEGKRIRSVDDAVKAFEKYKDVLNKRFSVKDRNAITNALKSLKYNEIAKNFTMFSKAFGYVGKALDAYELYEKFIEANETDEWRPFFVKAETLAVGGAATFVTAFAFSILLANPIGLLGYAFIIAIVGMLIDDELIEKINQLIGL